MSVTLLTVKYSPTTREFYLYGQDDNLLAVKESLTGLESYVALPDPPAKVYLDHPEDEPPTIGLEYVILGPKWNGFEEPWVTAAQMREFIATWRSNDPNGVWGDVRVAEFPGQRPKLIVTRSDSDDPADWDEFKWVGNTPAGEDIFQIAGWVFIQREED